jgi:hypothetical protein
LDEKRIKNGGGGEFKYVPQLSTITKKETWSHSVPFRVEMNEEKDPDFASLLCLQSLTSFPCLNLSRNKLASEPKVSNFQKVCWNNTEQSKKEKENNGITKWSI